MVRRRHTLTLAVLLLLTVAPMRANAVPAERDGPHSSPGLWQQVLYVVLDALGLEIGLDGTNGLGAEMGPNGVVSATSELGPGMDPNGLNNLGLETDPNG